MDCTAILLQMPQRELRANKDGKQVNGFIYSLQQYTWMCVPAERKRHIKEGAEEEEDEEERKHKARVEKEKNKKLG